MCSFTSRGMQDNALYNYYTLHNAPEWEQNAMADLQYLEIISILKYLPREKSFLMLNKFQDKSTNPPPLRLLEVLCKAKEANVHIFH